jgi:uncharacterized protein
MILPLDGVRVWLSGSIPDEATDADRSSMLQFISGLSRAVFREGGSIIHGSHPTFWPTLLQEAAAFQKSGGTRDCLTLAVSRHFSKESAKYGIPIGDWLANSTVHETPEVSGEHAQARSLELLREWMADRCDAVVVLGGKWWQENLRGAGVPAEFEMARERGLPCFLLGSLGGAAGGYLELHPEVLKNLKNGLDEVKNREIAVEHETGKLAELVLNQLRRLPLVRGPSLGGTTFRILALDGGGIKGTFTASVLANWEEQLKDKHAGLSLVDHFDLIAGTSTGGILAIGLGAGLRAAQMLKFYEDRGPKIFPLTSVKGKLWYGLRSLVRPKFMQNVLQKELEDAYAKAPAGTHLRDSLCRLVIPSCHARTGAAFIFRTNHHPDLVATAGRTMAEVALATSAAPTYFRAAEVGGSSYVDGGVWANNPVLVAIVEATARLRVPLDRIDILSVGTTSAPYSGRETLVSGLSGWLWKGRILELLMHAQAQGVATLAGSLAGGARLLRVDQTLLPGEVSLDSVNRIRDLKDYGIQVASQPDTVAQVARRFLNGVAAEVWRRYP